MVQEIDFQVINATFDTLAPLIRAHGADSESVERYVYYLLYISAAMADQLQINRDTFQALAISAYERGKSKLSGIN